MMMTSSFILLNIRHLVKSTYTAQHGSKPQLIFEYKKGKQIVLFAFSLTKRAWNNLDNYGAGFLFLTK
jgi:hypothetical protein